MAGQLRQSGADAPALPDLLAGLNVSLTAAGLPGRPAQLLADAGYFSAANLTATTAAGIDPLIATGRLRHDETPPLAPPGPPPARLTPKQQMAHKLRTPDGRAAYARRKAIIEPVFGQIQVAQNDDRLRLRGTVKADVEWFFHLACHNLRKLRNSGWTPTQPATT